jgi:alpha-ribazole phosphatase
MRLILLRHGRTGFSGRYVGSTDVPLSESGRAQILGMRPQFAAMMVDILMTSPMLRCTQTVDLLDLGLPVQLDSDLREIDFGRWEGKTFQEIEEQDFQLVHDWASATDDFCFPEGETISDFTGRIESVKNRLLTLEAETVLLVAHGGVIRALICSLLGLAPQNYLLFQVAKGYYSTIDLYDGGGVLTGFNLGGVSE